MEVLNRQNPHKGEACLAWAHMSRFTEWIKHRLANKISCLDERLLKLAKGTFFTVITYQGFEMNGYMFYTIDQDKKSMY
jgi:hypothetical protein